MQSNIAPLKTLTMIRPKMKSKRNAPSHLRPKHLFAATIVKMKVSLVFLYPIINFHNFFKSHYFNNLVFNKHKRSPILFLMKNGKSKSKGGIIIPVL